MKNTQNVDWRRVMNETDSAKLRVFQIIFQDDNAFFRLFSLSEYAREESNRSNLFFISKFDRYYRSTLGFFFVLSIFRRVLSTSLQQYADCSLEHYLPVCNKRSFALIQFVLIKSWTFTVVLRQSRLHLFSIARNIISTLRSNSLTKATLPYK